MSSAKAQSFLFWFSLFIILAIAVFITLRWCRLVSVQPGLIAFPVHWILPILGAASIGYLTNWAAIWMLFKPYEPTRCLHTFFTRESVGLIPGKKAELGQAVGDIVARELLTPEKLVTEIQGFIDGHIGDQAFLEEIRRLLWREVRANKDSIGKYLQPRITTYAGQALSELATPANFRNFAKDVVEPWLLREARGSAISEFVANWLKNKSPEIISFMQDAATRYNDGSTIKRFALWVAKRIGVINWDAIAQQMSSYLDTRKGREELTQIVIELGTSVKERLESLEDKQAKALIDSIWEETAEFLSAFTKEFLDGKMDEQIELLLNDEDLKRIFQSNVIPAGMKRLQYWFNKNGTDAIQKHFNICGHVAQAVEDMEPKTLHDKVKEVSGVHLGAIQTLGFFFGGIAGLLLATLQHVSR
jgi:uncharacterized membrane protein YheB (UPF0754 family)